MRSGPALRADPARDVEAEQEPVCRARRVASSTTIELHLLARPEPGADAFVVQARSMYERLHRELRAEGARASDLVAEKVFLSDLPAQVHEIQRIRREHLRREGVEATPAVTYVEQPPARRGQRCELQALAILPAEPGRLRSRPMEGLPPAASGRVVEAGGVKHVFLSNLTGGSAGDGTTFSRQAAATFARAEASLHREGLSFRDVARTWIYLKEIDRDYAALNRARREFFDSHGVAPPPASTGISGGPHPADRACMMDLRAVGGRGSLQVRPIHAPTMNEAPSYGSDFSRGTMVALEDRRIIHLSGTASIDAEGDVMHVGEIEGQVDRMLANVEALLASEGAGYADLVSAVTYLKRAEYRTTFLEVSRRRGLPEWIPNTLCVADVCRPEWLCEMEAIAVLV